MARPKATSSDVYAKLARGECANFQSGCCMGRTPCTIINGEPCEYFSSYVQPLLEYSEFTSKYSREAKIAVALNPRAKVIRKRRQAKEPVLALDTPVIPKTAASQPQAKPHAAMLPKRSGNASHASQDIALTTVVTVSGDVHTKIAATGVKQRTAAAKKTIAPPQPQLSLEIAPTASAKTRAGKRR